MLTVDAHIAEIVHSSGVDDYGLFLTGDKCNRRNKYPEYKAKRASEKPAYHPFIREYLICEYNAIVTDDGREADDLIAEICISEWKSWSALNNGPSLDGCLEYIACSSDKDFNTFPGWHYNPKWRVKYWVSEEDAELWLACQLIMGDSCDNIKGLPDHGSYAAYNILKDCTDPLLRAKLAYQYHYRDNCTKSWSEEYNKNLELLKIG